MLVTRSVARDHDMSALKQFPLAFAQPMQVEIVAHDKSLWSPKMRAPDHSLQKISCDHNQIRVMRIYRRHSIDMSVFHTRWMWKKTKCCAKVLHVQAIRRMADRGLPRRCACSSTGGWSGTRKHVIGRSRHASARRREACPPLVRNSLRGHSCSFNAHLTERSQLR